MFTAPSSRGKNSPMAAQTAARRLRRPAGILAGLAGFFLACGAVAPAAFAASAPAGTSASASGIAPDIAFQANTNILYTYSTATGNSVKTNLGMDAATSPSISN